MRLPSVCGACVGDVRGRALGGRDVATRICSREGGFIYMTWQLFFDFISGVSDADPALGAAVKAWEKNPHKAAEAKIY